MTGLGAGSNEVVRAGALGQNSRNLGPAGPKETRDATSAPPPPVHRAVAALLAAALISASCPARAEGAVSSSGRDTAKSVVVWSALGAEVVSLGVTLAFLAQANGARSDYDDAVARAGGSSDGVCRTPAQCAAVEPYRQDADDARDRVFVAGAVTAGISVAAIVAVILVSSSDSDSSKRSLLKPTFTNHGAGATMEARF